MRMMSFALTTEQMRRGTKTVTRRLGWRNLRPGERVQAVVRCMGLKRGERVERLGVIEVVSVRRERLCEVDLDDVAAEGFPGWSDVRFIREFCRHMRCTAATPVTRIEFRHVAAEETGGEGHGDAP